MRIPMRAISLAFSASLALILALAVLFGISIPAFASGDDKSAAPGSAAVKNAAPVPDREKEGLHKRRYRSDVAEAEIVRGVLFADANSSGRDSSRDERHKSAADAREGSAVVRAASGCS